MAMTQAQYARHRGVSRQAVHKLVKARKIPVRSDGTIDPADADFALGEARERIDTPPEGSRDNRSEVGGLTAARTAEAVYSARLKQLQYERECNRLLPVDQVVAAASACAGEMVRQIDRIASRADELTEAIRKDGVLGARTVLKAIARDLRHRAGTAFAAVATDAVATDAGEDSK